MKKIQEKKNLVFNNALEFSENVDNADLSSIPMMDRLLRELNSLKANLNQKVADPL